MRWSGSGKPSSFYSDYTFGCWDGDLDASQDASSDWGGAVLLPVGKAHLGFTDAELKELDKPAHEADRIETLRALVRD